MMVLSQEEQKELIDLTDKITLLGLRINWLGLSPFITKFAKPESVARMFDKHVNLMSKFISEYKQLRVKEVMS